MKYSDKNPPLVCMMTQSTCYKGTTVATPVGILWHDTAGGNPELRRYVQPDDNDPKKQELIAKIGKNAYNNDWNHADVAAGLNCWVGKLANGEVTTVQTMPWNYRPWGCGSGAKGSCNGTTGGKMWIQFEICDDGYNNGTKAYFEKAYKEACELTAYLCKKFNIDPKGTVQYNGVTVPTILCHWDSYKLGLGSGHSDIYTWFGKFDKDMTDVRNDVAALLKAAEKPAVTPVETTTEIKVGDLVRIKEGAKYYSGKNIPAWVAAKNFYVKSIKGERVVIDKSEDGKASINSAMNLKDLEKVAAKPIVIEEPKEEFKSYVVRVTANALNVRKGPSTDYGINTVIYKNEVYTIVEEKNGWGKLKSGAGWINLSYTEKR